RRQTQNVTGKIRQPRTGRIDENTGADLVAMPFALENKPPSLLPLRPDTACPCPNDRAALRRIHRVEDDQARIVDPAIGVFETKPVASLERRADNMVGEIERARR